jgi:hypothetical protein
MDRRRFLLTSLAGALAAPFAARGRGARFRLRPVAAGMGGKREV